MAKYTTNYNLTKPDENENYDVEIFNDNADTVDTELKKVNDALANKADASNVVTSVAGKTGAVTLTKSDVSLNNVDNTADTAKPISTAMQTALDKKVNNTSVLTDVPANAVFTDTKYTAGNNVSISEENVISATNTTYTEISTNEIDEGTSSALRLITGRRMKHALDKKVDTGKVLTDVPANAKFTDTKYSAGTNVSIDSSNKISATDTKTTINGKTGAIAKADIVALGIPAQDTTYTAGTNITIDVNNRISVIPPLINIYGVEIDETNSNPLTSVVYTDSATKFIPASGNDGNFSWGSWEDIIKNEFAIRPCILKNNGGEVDYYLDYDDYTKKADGSASVIDGTAGDVMVEFGVPLWWKFERIGNKLKIQLSNGEFDGAIKPAFEIENGYNLVSIYQLFLTQILYLLMFKNLNSQTALGRGKVSSGYTNTGTTNTKTFCHGTTSDSDNVKFLGMEDYWGNRRWWIDGCFYNSSRNILIGKGSFNDTGNGYINHGQASSVNLKGFTDKVQGGNHTGFIPASTGGSDSQYYCDYGTLSASGMPSFGGYAGGGSYAGGFYLRSYSASGSDANVGGRLSFTKDNKIYIGAYLGYTQSNKLRSRSGVTSSNNKTIGAFRTEAKANN